MQVLAPVPVDRRPSRLVVLFTGLIVYGFGEGLMLKARLGLDPWDVLHQGLSRSIGLQVGTWTDIVGAIVLLGWIPLHQRPGFGTVANVIVLGLALNVSLDVWPTPHQLGLRILAMVVGVLASSAATAVYIGVGMGPGPRDGLMTGLAARGHSIRVVRTAMELTVLVAGFCLGGTVGAGTVLFAVTVGPVVHALLPVVDFGSGSRHSQREPLPA